MSKKAKELFKEQRFGIRKFTLGAASIVIGTTFYLANDHDAQAAEVENDANVSTETTSNNTPDTEAVKASTTNATDDTVQRDVNAELGDETNPIETTEPAQTANEIATTNNTAEETTSNTEETSTETTENVENNNVTPEQPVESVTPVNNDVSTDSESVEPEENNTPVENEVSNETSQPETVNNEVETQTPDSTETGNETKRMK